MGSLDFLLKQNIDNPKGKGLYRVIVEFSYLSFPGEIIRKEGEKPVNKKDFDNVYEHIETTYNFFKQNYGRDSLDDKGKAIIVVGDYPPPTTAQWSTTNKQIYITFQEVKLTGALLGVKTLKKITISGCGNRLDIIAHEFTHGVHDYCAGEFSINPILVLDPRKIAISEHLADVFAVLCQNWSSGIPRWKVGLGLFKELPDLPLRSLNEEPDSLNGALTMDDFVYGLGGLSQATYKDSKILSHAFYIFSVYLGGSFEIEAYDIPGKIWFEVLTSKDTDADFEYSKDFESFANATLFYCTKLYPEHEDKLKFAWKKVKVLDPFEDECDFVLLELEYQAAYYRYWHDLGYRNFKYTPETV